MVGGDRFFIYPTQNNIYKCQCCILEYGGERLKKEFHAEY